VYSVAKSLTESYGLLFLQTASEEVILQLCIQFLQ